MNTLTGEMNELQSAVCSIEGLAEAEQRAADPRELRDIRLALLESLNAVRFLAADIRRKLPAIETLETRHVH